MTAQRAITSEATFEAALAELVSEAMANDIAVDGAWDLETTDQSNVTVEIWPLRE